MKESHRDTLLAVLKKEPCTLLHLNLDRATCNAEPCFSGMTIADVLVPSTGTLACRKLRHLNLALCGLIGELPPEILQMKELFCLNLYENKLSGTVPSWLGDLYKLEILHFHNNE